MRYNGKDISIAINVHKEHRQQVWECLARVHRNMPDAAVKVWANGEARPDVRIMADSFCFDFAMTPNYFGKGLVPLWHGKHLRWFAQESRVYNLKIDCDTMVDRTPKELPNADYFGTIDYSPTYTFIQGGCEGLSLSMVQRILSTNYLDSVTSPYRNPSHFAAEEISFGEDWAMGHMCRSLGVEPTLWPECNSHWKGQCANYLLRHAIVHPRYHGQGKYDQACFPPSPEYRNG